MEQGLKVRRVVTGHDENGKAIIKIDDIIHGNKHNSDAEFALVWTTDALPSDNTDEFDGSKREVGLTSPGGTVLRFVDMYPGKSSPMHRTQSLDYGIVLEGEIELELDDDVKVLMRAGDVIVQRGTIHAWNNNTDHICRIAFILVDALPLTIGDSLLEPVKENG